MNTSSQFTFPLTLDKRAAFNDLWNKLSALIDATQDVQQLTTLNAMADQCKAVLDSDEQALIQKNTASFEAYEQQIKTTLASLKVLEQSIQDTATHIQEGADVLVAIGKVLGAFGM